MKRSESMESLEGATLGVPNEPGKEFDEMVDEVVEEVSLFFICSISLGFEWGSIHCADIQAGEKATRWQRCT